MADIKGGRYTSKQNGNGTWDIFRVPILCAHERSMGKAVKITKDGKPELTENIFTVDEKWLKDSLALAKKRYAQDAYLGPIHVRHHGSSEQVTRAGFLLPCEVGTAKHDGLEKATLFADLIQVPAAIYAEIRANGLPYVSVEILDTTAPAEIDSLALMDHAVPYFKFPLLTIGKEIATGAEVHAVEEAGAVMAYARSSNRASILCYMKGGEMEKPEKDTEEDKQGAPIAAKEAPEAVVPPEKAGKTQDQSGGLMNQMMQMLSAIMGRLGIQMGGGMPVASPVEQGGGDSVMAAKPDAAATVVAVVPVLPEPVTTTASGASTVVLAAKPAGLPEVDPAKTSPAIEQMFAALKGEIDGLKSKIGTYEADSALKAKADATAKDLAQYGVKADEVYALIKGAPEAAEKTLAAYAAAVKAHGIKDPSPTFAADATINMEAYPAEVLSYSSPEKVATAAKLWRDWVAVKEKGCSTPLKDWLGNLMESPFKK